MMPCVLLKVQASDGADRPGHPTPPPPAMRWAALQVAAYTSGRAAVSEYDCLLLRHCLWQRPDESQRIYDWLLR